MSGQRNERLNRLKQDRRRAVVNSCENVQKRFRFANRVGYRHFREKFMLTN